MANTNILFLFETLVLNALHTSHYPKEVPWELPEGWAWIYGQDLFSPMESITPKGDYFDYIDIDAIDNQRSIISSPKRIPVKNAPSRASRKTRRGDVLFSMVRPYLRNIARVDYDNCIASTGFYVCHSSGLVTSNYCFILMLSNYVVEGLNQYMKGDNSPSINNNHITSWLYPVPPISEQERISAAVDKLLYCIDVLFDGEKRIFESIVTTKTKILDLAIHGKLVPQDPSEEPALDLLRRINPAFTPSHNLHYEGSIPSGWQIVRMGDVIEIVSGTSYQKTDIVPAGTGIRVLRGGNIQDGNILICEDDVFINSSLANKGNTIDYPETQIGAFLRIIRPKSICISEYLGLIFQTEYYKHHIKQVAKGTNINNIKSSYITEFVIPLPPLEEQRRIQCQLKRLLSLVDQITDSINGSE